MVSFEFFVFRGMFYHTLAAAPDKLGLTTPPTNTARFLEMGVFAPARAPGLRLVGKVG